ncbi:hypothetical protein ACAW74_00135 [Fibrella sp. WM1]|uniref:hypothetical protein n=1 Tax=Fibrella musci TaxID=3242485 RepID=UPI0035207D69
MALLTSIFMGLFFAELARTSLLKWLIRGAFGAYALYVAVTGFGKTRLFLNLDLFAPLDVALFGLSLFFLINLLRHSYYLSRKPLFWLLLAICLGALYDMAVAQLGTLLAQYAGNRWLDLFWLKINPVVTMGKLAIYTYGFYLTRFQLVKSDALPRFAP